MKTQTLKTLAELAKSKGYKIRSCHTPLSPTESFANVVKPFEFSSRYGGTLDAHRYYNNYYLYPTK